MKLKIIAWNVNSIRALMKKEDLIDPKNPHTVGRSFANLGNHTLTIIWVSIIAFIVYASYN